MRIDEFDAEKKWWNKRKESEVSWKVTIADIKKGNYNLDIKNPNVVDEDQGDPQELLKSYHEITKEIIFLRDKLKKELMNALENNK